MPETTKNKKNIGAREERDGSQKKRNSDGEAVNKDPTGKKKQKLKNTESIAAPKDSAQPLTVTASGSEAKKSEIDDLFGQLKAKKSKPVPPPAEAENLQGKINKEPQDSEKKSDKKSAKLEGNKDDIFGSNTGEARKRTEEGFRIYSEDELGFGKRGGDTPQCPFDCDCCF